MVFHRKWTGLLFVSVMFVALALSGPQRVLAVDTNYSGYIDTETNTADDGEETVSTPGVGRIVITETMSYDYDTHNFIFPVDSTLSEVQANVADGMVTGNPVRIVVAGDMPVVLYRNGTAYEGDMGTLTTPGDYVVSVLSSGNSRRLFGFTIIGSTTNAIHTFVVPDGFMIQSALFNDEDVYQDRYTVNMEEEGTYVIEYECLLSDVVYKLETTIDRTAPEILLSGIFDERGYAHSAVKFSGLQNGDTYTLTLDGQNYTPLTDIDGLSGTITETGSYVMEVRDPAGNSQEYRFAILMYLNISSLAAIGLIVLSVAFVIGYVIFKRRHLKIG